MTRAAIVGASGYVGRRLSDHLAANGFDVVALARRPLALKGPTQGPGSLRSVSVDIADEAATTAALQGSDVAFYLVHAMADEGDFASRDRALAAAFARSARRAGTGRIVYLGGLGGGNHEKLSAHLASRQEVADILAGSGTPFVELRAAVVLGAGSISFEMLRSLTERLPAMVCPRWVRTRLQPVAESDLMDYLAQSVLVPPGTYEIGSPDVTSYREMINIYAAERGLRPRWIVTVPLLSTSLSARWVDLVSPVNRKVSHALIESLVNEVVVVDPAPAGAFSVRPMPVRAAIAKAIADETARLPDELFERAPGLEGGIYTVRREVSLQPGTVEALRDNIALIGGSLDWYGLAWAWRLRLALGRLFGEHLTLSKPPRLEMGAQADWWRAARVDRGHLVLASVDWAFGEAWLGYQTTSRPPALLQVAAFRPKGLLGLAYWRALWPVHWLVFWLMCRAQIRAARRVRIASA